MAQRDAMTSESGAWSHRKPTWPGLVITGLVAASASLLAPDGARAGSWDTWLQNQADEIIEEGKKVFEGDEPPEDTPAAEQELDSNAAPSPQPAATPSVPQQPTQAAQDAPRYDSDWVVEIQSRLTNLGYAPGPVDGAFGNKTGMAILAFQRDTGLPADGMPRPSVMRTLKAQSQAYQTAHVTQPSAPASTVLVAAAESSLSGADIRPLGQAAGIYLAWAELCSDPARLEIKDESLAALRSRLPEVSIYDSPEQDEAAFLQRFNRKYKTSSKGLRNALKYNPMKEICAGDTEHGSLEEVRADYETQISKWQKAPAASTATSDAPSVATQAAPAVTTSQQSTTSPQSPQAPSSSSATSNPLAWRKLSSFGGSLVAATETCGDQGKANKVRAEYLSLTERLPADDKDAFRRLFDSAYDNYDARDCQTMERMASKHYEKAKRSLGFGPSATSPTTADTGQQEVGGQQAPSTSSLPLPNCEAPQSDGEKHCCLLIANNQGSIDISNSVTNRCKYYGFGVPSSASGGAAAQPTQQQVPAASALPVAKCDGTGGYNETLCCRASYDQQQLGTDPSQVEATCKNVGFRPPS